VWPTANQEIISVTDVSFQSGGKPVQPTQYKTHDFLALLVVTLLVINIGIS
jgi:hypothetical protein